MADLALTYNEPVATGWLRTELLGDHARAALYLQTARGLLGTLRSTAGVNARIAEGDAGGFYRQQMVTDDGVFIEATTNNGMDTIRITAPFMAPGKDPEAKKPETTTVLPYLWVGVRIVAGGRWAKDNWHFNTLRTDSVERQFTNVPHVCMWEPPSHNGGEYTILSNRESFIPTRGMSYAGIGDLIPVSGFLVFDVPYDHADYPLYYQNKFIPPKSDMAGIDTRIVYTDKKLCMIPRYNSLNIPMRAPDYSPTDPDVTWDFMFVGDPENAMGIDGTLGAFAGDVFTPHVVPPVSADYFDNLPPAIGGEYFFKFALEGRECRRVLAEPFVVEIRCIVGRGTAQISKTHRVTLTEATDYFCGLMPKGFYNPGPLSNLNPAVRDAGPNRHGPHWWQGMLTVFVPPMQIDVPLDEVVPPSIYFSPDGEVGLPPDNSFEPGPYFPPLTRCEGGQYYD